MLVVTALFNLSGSNGPVVAGVRLRAPQHHNLPAPVNSFVGREVELQESSRLLATASLLTFTGFGGAGKTRLALQVAASLPVESFPDGTWLVELAELQDPSLLPQVVASVLGVHDEPTSSRSAGLSDYLRNRRLLLVLDSCSGVKILVTSRTVLGIVGEVVFPVANLPVPQILPTPLSSAELMRYAGAQLFVERAVAYSPTFAVTPASASGVAETGQDPSPLARRGSPAVDEQPGLAQPDGLDVKSSELGVNEGRLGSHHARTSAWHVSARLDLPRPNRFDRRSNRFRPVKYRKHGVVRARLARTQPDHRPVRASGRVTAHVVCRRFEPHGIGPFSQMQPLEEIRKLFCRPFELHGHTESIVDHRNGQPLILGCDEVVRIHLFNETGLRCGEALI
jgi:hypothetical protein